MPDLHINNYYGSILDPLHGDIKLSETEKWILSQPIFSRLRKIKQNTFLYYVFPSSNHTRFEHSIGVMHLASKIYNSCKENYTTGTKKSSKHFKTDHTTFFNLEKLIDREPAFYQELRLAALLHDIGHGPMSHLFDEFAISKGPFLSIIKNNPVLEKYISGFEDLINSNKDKVEHEIMSCVFVFYLIDKLKKESISDPYKFSQSAQKIINDISAERIVKMIEPKFKGIKDIEDKENFNYTNFFSRIITGFPIDADRMDYLLRDSYFSGVTYGIYDINRIFASFIPILIDDKVVKLGYKESGSDSMLRFIQSRSHLFNQVYYHKTNRAANSMLLHGTNSIRKRNDKLLDNSKELDDIIEFYTKNGDEYFLTNTIKSDDPLETEIITDLINRKLFKRIYRKRITISHNRNDISTVISDIHTSIVQKLNSFNINSIESNLKIFAAADLSKNENYKDSAGDKTVLLVKKNNDNSYKYSDKWIDHSLEFSNLNLITYTLRIYINRSFSNPNDFEEYNKLVIADIQEELNQLESIDYR